MNQYEMRNKHVRVDPFNDDHMNIIYVRIQTTRVGVALSYI